MLACGATDSMGVWAPFSSCGPTADGRIKPDVVAQGLYVYCASTNSYNEYQFWGGTSFSTPLVAGCACLMVEAHPDWHPRLIMQAMRETADNAQSPDEVYGWGMVNIDSALKWGPHMVPSARFSDTPLTIQFMGESVQPTSDWRWDFGDGDSAFVQSPSHTYSRRGLYDVGVTATTPYGDLGELRKEFIAIVDDSLQVSSATAAHGRSVSVDIVGTNTVPLYQMTIPIVLSGDLGISVFDSVVAVGCRTEFFQRIDVITLDPAHRRGSVTLRNNSMAVTPYLPPGTGPVLSVFFTVPSEAEVGQQLTVSVQPFADKVPKLFSEHGSYDARHSPGTITVVYECCEGFRGDVDLSGGANPDIADLTYLVAFMFRDGPEPLCMKEADIDGSGGELDISDLTYLIGYMFREGPAPPDCE
jgi:PKD repeat protein